MAKSKPTPKATRTPVEILEAARKTLTEEGTVKLAALGPPASRPELAAQLVQEGYEVAKSVIRKPVRAQIEGVLESGAFIPLKSIASHVVGATAKEAQAVAKVLLDSGGAKLVQRGAVEVLVPSRTAVMPREDLLRFAEFAKLVAKVASAKSKASLLQDDFLEELRRFLPSGVTVTTARPPRGEQSASPSPPNAPTPPGAAQPQANLKELLSAVDANRDPQTGLSFVPKIVSSLQGQLAPEVTRATLLEAATQGLLELRPEGGIGRLSEEELSVCPPGPQGTRLSWARRTGTNEEAIR